MTAIHPKFWKSEPRAIKDSLHHVSDQYAVVELENPYDMEGNTWGCIDKDFSVGHIFAYKTTKEFAISFCEEMIT